MARTIANALPALIGAWREMGRWRRHIYQGVADTIAPEAACTSTQFHLQVSPDEFAAYWNAAQVIAVRSQALSRLDIEGGMVSVVMPEPAVRDMLSRWGDRLSVAAVNSPAATRAIAAVFMIASPDNKT